jgi:hypothetical protein
MATLKGESAFAADEAAAQAQEQLERAHQKFEEGRARWEAEASKRRRRERKCSNICRPRPYRTKDRGRALQTSHLPRSRTSLS